MNYQIEVRVNQTSPTRGKASAHIILGDEESLTITDISVWEENEKVKISLPMNQYGGRKHPCITLQGNLKKNLIAMVAEQFLKLRHKQPENKLAKRV